MSAALIPPQPTTRSEYSEDEILRALHELYRVFERIGYAYVDSVDGVDEDAKDDVHYASVNYAPPGGRELDFLHCKNVDQIDSRVKSLLKKMPTFAQDGIHVSPDLCAVPYHSADSELTDPWQMQRNFDVKFFDQEREMPSTMLKLFSGDNGQYCDCLLLDVADSKDTQVLLLIEVHKQIELIDTVQFCGRELDNEHLRNEPDPMVQDAHEADIYSWPAEDAPTYIWRMVQKYLDAEWVAATNLHEIIEVNGQELWTLEIQRLLKEQYGWLGENFRRQAWKDDVGGLVAALGGEFDQESGICNIQRAGFGRPLLRDNFAEGGC